MGRNSFDVGTLGAVALSEVPIGHPSGDTTWAVGYMLQCRAQHKERTADTELGISSI